VTGEKLDMSIPSSSIFEDGAHLDEMAENAKRATALLKALGHEGRLMILCYLASGEKSVTALEDLLSLRQPAVSQQLARLRADDIITPRRDGKTIYYSISDERARRMMELVYEMFCADSDNSTC
jgi:DNA-binding transcriptional ArsR family regulator